MVFIVLACSTGASAVGRYETALGYFETGDHDAAVIELRNVLQADPNNLAAIVLLGKTLLAAGQPRRAVAELDRGLGLGGDENLILVPLAQAHLASLAPEKVLLSIVPRGRDRATDGEILLLRGDAALLLGDLRSAAQSYGEAQALLPEDPRPVIGHARVALSRGQAARANPLIDQALAANPDAVQAWTLKGMVHRDRGEYAAAATALDRALALDPASTKALGARAAMWLATGDEVSAARDIATLRAADPGDLEGLYLASLLLFREGQNEHARDMLRDSTVALEAIAPATLEKIPLARLMLGIVRFYDAEYEQAAEILGGFYKRFPAHTGARQYLAATYLATRDWSEVIRILNPRPGEALPDDPVTLSLLASAYRANGDFDRAAKLYERAVALAPQHAGLRMRLLESRFETGEAKTAIDGMEKLVARLPGVAEAGIVLVEMYVKAGRIDDALSLGKRLVAQQGDDALVHNALGATHLAAGDFAAAAAHFTAAADLAPQAMLPQLNRARLAIHTGDTAAAVEQYRELRTRYPGSAAIAAEFAAALLDRGDLDTGEDIARDLVDRHPDDSRGHLALLRARLERGQTEELETRVFAILERFPRDARALTAIGRLYAGNGDIDDARMMFRRAAEQAQFDADILHEVALEQHGIGDTSGAQWSLTKALDGDPTHRGALAARVAVLGAQQKWAAATETLGVLQSRYPDHFATLVAAGDLAAARGDTDTASAAFARAHDARPSRATVRRLFSAQLAAGNVDGALHTIRKWIVVDPLDVDSRHLLAEKLIESGAIRAAQLVYEGIVKRGLDDAVTANNLAYVYQTQGDPRALALAKRAVAGDPDNAGFLDTYGWILTETGQAERGLEILRDAYTRQSTNQQIRFHIALALLKLGRTAAARRELSGALDSGRSFAGERDARALLAKFDAAGD